jgi:hypothetical protein
MAAEQRGNKRDSVVAILHFSALHRIACIRRLRIRYFRIARRWQPVVRMRTRSLAISRRFTAVYRPPLSARLGGICGSISATWVPVEPPRWQLIAVMVGAVFDRPHRRWLQTLTVLTNI